MATETEKGTFDADQKMLENTSRVIKIGGEDWHPAKRSGNVAKRLAALGDPPEGDDDTENVAANMDYLYNNLVILLVNKEGEHPGLEWLLDNLEWNVAQELIQFLNPELAEAINPPTTPPTRSPESELQKPVPSPLSNVSEVTSPSVVSTS